MALTNQERLGTKVRELRYRLGMTQAQLAGRAGVGEKTLKRLELGKTDSPHPETLAAVAGALGMKPEELFEAAEAFNQHAMAAMPALHQLPRPPRNFTGREQELRTLLERVEQDGVPVVAIQGLGGIGKTALALVAAERLSARFPDGQFYLDLCGASTPANTVDAMLHVIRSIEPERRQPKTDAEVEAAYRSVLCGRRCLLLMDNAWSREQVEHLAPPDGSLMLLTSRLRFTLPGEWACSLAPMPEDDSRALLRSLAPHAEDVLDRLAGACGGLPLALSLAARALAERPDLDPSEYAARLADDHSRLRALDAADRGAGVEASFTLSYGMLDPEQQLGLGQLSIFPQHFDRQAAAAIWNVAEDVADGRIGRLVRFNLLESSGAGRAARYRLHDLVRLFAAGRLTEIQRSECAMRYARHYLQMLGAAEAATRTDRGSVRESLEPLDSEWVHIHSAFELCQERAADDLEATRLCQTAPSAFTLLRLRLPPDRRIVWGKVALGLLRETDPLTGHYLADAARAHLDLGDPRSAIECANHALEVANQLADEEIETSALVALGDAHHALGSPTEAIEYAERALSLARRSNRRFDEALALVVSSWGYRVLGEFEKSVARAEEALPIARALHDRAVEGSVLLTIAFVRRAEQHTAHAHAQESLAIARELGDRRIEGYSLIALSDDRSDDPRYHEGLSIAREIGDRRMEGHALVARGSALVRARKAKLAVSVLQEGHRLGLETGDRAMQSLALAVLGIAHAALGSFEGAERTLDQAEQLCQRTGNRRLATVCAWFLSLALEKQDKLSQALAAAERVAAVLPTAQWHRGLHMIGDADARITELQARVEAAAS